jgi:hypothetical protein
MADCQAISETLLLMDFGRFATAFAARTTPSLYSVATIYPSCEVCGIPQTTIASIEYRRGNLGVEHAKASMYVPSIESIASVLAPCGHGPDAQAAAEKEVSRALCPFDGRVSRHRGDA